MMSEYQELRISNDIMEDAEALRERIDGEGYLFFKRLQKPEKTRPKKTPPKKKLVLFGGGR